MILRNDSKFPTRRAFVLKVRGDATPNAITGRLENLVTGWKCEFASGNELLDLIVRDLESRGAELASDV